jgi:hypothetical protein
MIELIYHTGSASGIDDGLYGNTDLGTPQKIISIDRYLPAIGCFSRRWKSRCLVNLSIGYPTFRLITKTCSLRHGEDIEGRRPKQRPIAHR